MLMTKLKAEESVMPLLTGKVFVLNCHGCKEVGFPEAEAEAMQKKLVESGIVTGILTTDYICDPENLKYRLSFRQEEIDAADIILVFSCGVGVQTVADLFETKRVFAACDSIALPGTQGVTPSELTGDCGQCGECWLNMTGGICPIAGCSKSLVNGPCGGTKCGSCEVDADMPCAWDRIYKRLEKQGRLDLLRGPVNLRNFSTDDAVKEWKES